VQITGERDNYLPWWERQARTLEAGCAGQSTAALVEEDRVLALALQAALDDSMFLNDVELAQILSVHAEVTEVESYCYEQAAIESQEAEVESHCCEQAAVEVCLMPSPRAAGDHDDVTTEQVAIEPSSLTTAQESSSDNALPRYWAAVAAERAAVAEAAQVLENLSSTEAESGRTTETTMEAGSSAEVGWSTTTAIVRPGGLAWNVAFTEEAAEVEISVHAETTRPMSDLEVESARNDSDGAIALLLQLEEQQQQQQQVVNEENHSGGGDSSSSSSSSQRYRIRTALMMHKQRGTNEDTDCAICCGAFEEGDAVSTLVCNHQYHQACIYKWVEVRPVCPLCKMDIQGSDIDLEPPMSDSAAYQPWWERLSVLPVHRRRD
jgi:hypothetical protein